MRKLHQLNSSKKLFFRKWSRKSFTLFSVMKKAVAISVLPITYLLSAPTVAMAQEVETVIQKSNKEYDLEEVEVAAQRIPAVYSQVARVVNVIDSSQIQQSAAQNIPGLLEQIAGVDVRQRGVEGVQTDVSIRGGSFDQILILLNGINITDPQTGHHNFDLPVPIHQIKRIEILEGSAARIYGPNAFSGAINIVTQTFNSNQIKLNLSAGSHKYIDAEIATAFKTKDFKHTISYNRKSSDGYIDNTDFAINQYYYSGKYANQSGKLTMQLSAVTKDFGAQSFYSALYPNEYEETVTYLASIKWQSTGRFHLTPSLYWRRHFDEFQLYRDNPEAWYKHHNYHRSDVYGAAVNSWFFSKLGKTSVGAEYRLENIISNKLGEPIKKIKKVEGETDLAGNPIYYDKQKDRSIISLFIEHSVDFNNLHLSAGVLVNYISSYSKLKFNPGVELAYQISKPLRFFIAANSSLRLPTFTDLYYEGPKNIGNPLLIPEKSLTIEGGLKIFDKFYNGQAAFFYREGKDIIDWVKKKPEDKWQTINLSDLTSYGAGFNFDFYPDKFFNKKHLPRKVSVSFLKNYLDKKGNSWISHYVLDNLNYKLTASVSQPVSSKFLLSVNYVLQDREGTFTLYENKKKVKERAYDPFHLVDLKLIYANNRLQWYVSAKNILDKKYYDIANVIQPGLWIKTGITYQIDL